MKKILLDVLVALAGIIVLASLWLNNVEMWTSTCAYKREIGVFSYFSYAEVSKSAGRCGELGVNTLGLLKTILASLSVVFVGNYIKSKITKRYSVSR